MDSFRKFIESWTSTPTPQDTTVGYDNRASIGGNEDIEEIERLTPAQRRLLLSNLPLDKVISIIWRMGKMKKPISV